MATSQYSKRFITKIKKVYIVALPILLVLTILFNNYVIDVYYRVFYRIRFKNQVEEIASAVKKTGNYPFGMALRISYYPRMPSRIPTLPISFTTWKT
ncbi:hypothetical protein BWI96_09245 [Siphonobacter sp. SORGH_AS_0500]|uniref:hypothetical protein n=1 Tax=Siphonobacter sp. SORGH_AS_0500 TaxID=1864824 RepID=UPI000CA79D3B|nr:hypothetical protein [Siphonobacter sp. SORGH_AS_0500]PKK37050.1 hypothetical protein BWI96_09245 [Siphonobacter sp. SORGH_AS_0500]